MCLSVSISVCLSVCLSVSVSVHSTKVHELNWTKEFEGQVQNAMALFDTAEMRTANLNKEKSLRKRFRDSKVTL